MMCNCEDPVRFLGGWVVVMSIHDNHGNFGEDPYDVGEGYDHWVWVRRRWRSVEMFLIMFT